VVGLLAFKARRCWCSCCAFRALEWLAAPFEMGLEQEGL
jgi:hypothetical protein